MKASYSVCVLGFNATEQLVLGSIFGLSARRNPKFVRHAEGGAEPDIFLVDADDVAAVTALVARNADRRVPTILIGASDHGTGWPRLSRPLQWARLFVAFDISIRPRTPPPGASAPEPAAPPIRGETTDPIPAAPDMADFDPDATLMIPGRARLLAQMRQATTAPMDADPAPESVPRDCPPTGEPGTPSLDAVPWVMVVDADESVRETLRAKLRGFRLNVECVASGEEAIGLTGRRHFACVFLDVAMPGVDGYQVCKLIKTRRAVRPTVVILLSGRGSPIERIRGRMAGCDGHLAKPVEEGRLYELIARYLPATAPA